jgi:predicted NAD/FAD-binding protein
MRGAQRIAVVGAGVSGLACAWLLSQKHEVTLYEAGRSLGGHTNTVDVSIDGLTHPVDTGFLVYNSATYPHLTALFAHLGVASVETEMSFAVSLEQPNLEWSGSSMATVFGQKRNCCAPISGACWPISCASTARASPGWRRIRTNSLPWEIF